MEDDERAARAERRAFRRMRFYMQLAFVAATSILALVIWGATWRSDHPETWTERPHQFVETDVRLAAAELHEEAPRMVDRNTMLMSVTSDRRDVIHNLRVDEAFERADAVKLRPEREAAHRAEACEDPRMRMIIARGGQFSWHYSFSRGQQFTVHVTSCPGA